MLKKRIILILLLISLITNVSVFATDVDTDGNTTTGEIVSPPTENTVTGNTEQKPEKEPEKEEEPKQEEPKPTQNGMYRITAVFELKADSETEAIEMAKDLMNMIGVEAQIGAE